nr:hypothetical protein [Tanacetum cinerariifolium]
MKSACSKLDLVFSGAVADVKDRFHSFTPLGKTGNSFGAFESTLVECQTENKKRLDNTSKNNQNQQWPNKRQNTGRTYTARHGEKKHYSRAKPLCSKCYYHHDGPCAPKCHQCNRFGHLARDCRSSTMPILLTSTKELEQVRRLHAMNVGTKGTTGEI